MQDGAIRNSPDADVVCIDLGTTNTRVWRLSAQGKVIARAKAQVGVRDTARAGSSQLLRQTLRTLIGEMAAVPGHGVPSRIIAAGMITSSLGLLEIPHIPAPAGFAELAAATRPNEFPDVTPLPIWLVPGVRSGGTPDADPATINRIDMMRGEETLCLGLLSLGLASGPATMLSLGSHWKAINIDDAGRIAGSVTSLAGEMIHAIQDHTILASALPQARPEDLDASWVLSGMEEQRRSGLPRTLFCVRQIQLFRDTSPQQRLAYLIGAFIGADLDNLVRGGTISPQTPVFIVGNKALAAAWQGALASAAIKAIVIDENQVEKAMLGGLTRILAACR